MTIIQTLMSYLSAHPQPLKQPATSLHLSQVAPVFLSSSEATSDTQETWFVYEQLFLSCLRVGEDSAARLCLQRLGDRFGKNSARIQALNGLYDEATASGRPALEDILKRYNTLLQKDPTSIQIEKRRIALLASLGRTEEAVTQLTKLLSHSPTDAEAWSHLASLYRSQGLYAQSTFCLEEVLLIYPNAYNVHARLGETAYIAAGNNDLEALADATRYFCRSVELCEYYLRGWYGLRLVTDRILAVGGGKGGGLERKKAQDLNAKATEKLAEIVRRAGSGEDGWQGFDGGELAAAKQLIEGESPAR